MDKRRAGDCRGRWVIAQEMTAAEALRSPRSTTGTTTLRVALVLWSGGVGGAERFTSALGGALRRNGVDARVVYVGDPRPTCDELVQSGVPFVSFGASRGREILRRSRTFAAMVQEAGRDIALLQSGGFLPAVIRIGGYCGKLVAVEHGALPTGHSALRDVIEQRSGAWALDALVAVSDFKRMRALERKQPRRVERIHNAVDLSRFSPTPAVSSPEGITIGFAGRLERGKGAQNLLSAVAAMRDRTTRVVVAGDGPERATLESLAKELGIGDRARFVGRQDDMPAVWRACDVCAVPSVEPEGAGIVAIEAAACGKPVVATAAGGLAELVSDGVSGFLVPPGDVRALTSALDVYASDPRLRERHGRAGRLRCEAEFDLETCAGRYIDLFNSL